MKKIKYDKYYLLYFELYLHEKLYSTSNGERCYCKLDRNYRSIKSIGFSVSTSYISAKFTKRALPEAKFIVALPTITRTKLAFAEYSAEITRASFVNQIQYVTSINRDLQ